MVEFDGIIEEARRRGLGVPVPVDRDGDPNEEQGIVGERGESWSSVIS